MVTIATYFHPVPGLSEVDNRETLALFCEKWGRSNVTRFGISSARSHPRFNELTELLATYPEVTPTGYRDQCFYRWLAYDQRRIKGPLLLMDYDVFPQRTVDLQRLADSFDKPTVLNGTNPCAVYLPDARFLSTIIDMLFLSTEPDQEEAGLHIGDNTVFHKQWQKIGGSVNIVSEYPSNGCNLIHFANRFVPANKAAVIRSTLKNLATIPTPQPQLSAILQMSQRIKGQ